MIGQAVANIEADVPAGNVDGPGGIGHRPRRGIARICRIKRSVVFIADAVTVFPWTARVDLLPAVFDRSDLTVRRSNV